MTETTSLETNSIQQKSGRNWIFDLLLIIVLLAGAYFRLSGLLWGDYQYLHPDERFLVWVGSDITPLKCQDPNLTIDTCPPDKQTWMSLSDYFNTATSTLNPNNRGHSFYVYGTLPMFLARFIVQWVFGHSGFMEMTQVGRALSVLADLITILLVYLIAARLFDKRVGLLAAAFSSAAVLQIQLSHFFTMDTFITMFTILALYFAVKIVMDPGDWGIESGSDPSVDIRTDNIEPYGNELGIDGTEPRTGISQTISRFFSHPLFLPSLGFGLALGMATASKLNAAPMALALPAAVLIRLARVPSKDRQNQAFWAFSYLVMAAFVSLLVFRILQPYAFSGPGFFGLKLNPQWLANLRELEAQRSADVDFPPAMQWARRSIFFGGKNLVLWGLGLPLGLLAIAGFIWAGWRILTTWHKPAGEWHRHALIWGWTAFYLGWQSLGPNPTMRYFLPVYPTLAILAGWAIIALWEKGCNNLTFSQAASPTTMLRQVSGLITRHARVLAAVSGSIVLVITVLYAYGFSRIYTRPITRVAASYWIYQNIPGPISLHIQTADGMYNQPIPYQQQNPIQSTQPYVTTFTPKADGVLNEIYLPHVAENDPAIQSFHLTAIIATMPSIEEPLASATLSAAVNQGGDKRGLGYTLTLDNPVQLLPGQTYYLRLQNPDGAGSLSIVGDTLANEGEWDDGLPLRVDGYDGFGGIYPGDVNFNMYWDDNPDKLARFLRILNESDYLVITSSRQWASLPRLPERFPMTTLYYRNLLGCPPAESIESCYDIAKPGMFQSNLGFNLVKVFQSDPSIGPFDINDQASEEAFTVYDHPKVFIFKKSQKYDQQNVQAILSAVDFSQVIRIPPMKAGPQPANLMLPPGRWEEQQQGGTWSQLFNPQALQNHYQVISVLIWYLSIFLLGLFVYPLLRIAFPGLSDKGYPVARTAGLLLLSYIVWLAGSFQIPFNRITISVAIAAIALLGGYLAYRQRDDLRQELHQRGRYFLVIEGLFLAFFVLDLLIRYGNPDLWHPYKGGEKPMDFSYFNAVLKSTTFPPYDPWYAGGYLNYYYYGFVFVGVLVKWLGIVPSIAYNLILPTIFGMIAMGAFSIAWNLIQGMKKRSLIPISGGSGEHVVVDIGEQPEDVSLPVIVPSPDETGPETPVPRLPFVAGISAALGMALLGNLGTVQMIFQGFEKLAAPGGAIDNASIFTRWLWAAHGFMLTLTGASLPYDIGAWYWDPSRIIPAPGEVEPITEFPFFTVLYADPHAHLFAMPIALLALTFVLAMVLGRGRWKNFLGVLSGFFLGGLAIGALRPTNTWDFPTYLALGVVAVGYSLWAHFRPSENTLRALPFLSGMPDISRRLLAAAGGIVLLVGLAFVLFQPYAEWYGLGYASVQLWEGTHTPVNAYLTHWGLFLFVIVSWMAWETRDWMANTPLSSLQKLAPYKGLISGVVVLLVLAVMGLMLGLKVQIAWLALPLAAWAGVLLLRPGQADSKRFILFLIGTGLVLTLMVEVIVLKGDIARMNTVFKFYLQVWTLFAVSAGAALGWLIMALPQWLPRWRSPWKVVLIALVAGAALYPILGGMAKVKDRMVTSAPHTLDGMLYMDYAQYDWQGVMDLSQDYNAIRWMQENVKGSPVIVEANLRDLYRWGSRFSIYTGLPGVVGWEWHEQQQRALVPSSWISDRISEIDNFYQTTDLSQAQDFLNKYNVKYIIVGQLERNHYPGPGLDKFPAANGALWRQVYHQADTTIYEVIQK